ncbi:hypothetical protein FB479_11674 [Brevibacillus sp. AG162]|uniref:phage baseplate plug family protein n=1 Tax=Brevibacillus sp. AG162 TaxID=2572910 RepID=UPI001152CFDA|nr:hypothetical protein [Brevibacillus sp. AG162]TQK41973.1 hypothetical protein FB479_11674 [Brevibacillus sp. AG162]
MEYIDIDKNEIPYRFEIDLAGRIYGMEIHYNYSFDFFTVNLSSNGEPIIVGEKIVYGRPLFSYSTDLRLPKVAIVPRDLSGLSSSVGWNELGTSVFLMVEQVGV